MSREIIFRQYNECQNGHPRFLYWKPKDGFNNEVYWGEKHPECNCSTFAIGEGFVAKAPHEQWSGLTDKNNTKIFEGDQRKTDSGYFEQVFYSKHQGAFCIDYSHNQDMDETYSELLSHDVRNFEVIGNIHDKITKP